MPIKINLLAEAQELEELKRRDPVKRLAFLGIILVVLILGWSSLLVGKSMMAKSELSRLQGEIKAKEDSYKQVLESLDVMVDIKRRLVSIDRLATNRFLIGSLLNTFQRNTMEHIQLTMLKVDQKFELLPEVKPAKGTKQIPKPATIKENNTILISVKDSSSTPGDQVTKFQQLLSKDAYFKGVLDPNGFRLTALGAAQLDTDGRACVPFTLEARVPEKIR
jgi:hypothetical protein